MSTTINTFGIVGDPVEILNWRRFDGRLTTSDQPTEEQPGAIKQLGVTNIVNLGLHNHEKALPDESATVSTLGMRYIHIPVDFASPTEKDFDRFREAMHLTRHEQTHVHCIINARVSAFMCRYQRDVLGIYPYEAYSTMETIWRPGGSWAQFLGKVEHVDLPSRYAGGDY